MPYEVDLPTGYAMRWCVSRGTHHQQLRVARLDSLVLLGCGFAMIPSSGEETNFLFFHQSWKPLIQSWKLTPRVITVDKKAYVLFLVKKS